MHEPKVRGRARHETKPSVSCVIMPERQECGNVIRVTCNIVVVRNI